MCGIAGVLSYSTTELTVDKNELQMMAEVQLSRGPDQQNYWLSKKKNIGFAHQRLSIIDLTEAASQPMYDEDGRFVIVFNGEIYNFKELRKQCQQKGIKFKSYSDTEVLLALYKLYSEKMLNMLRGMFAFAIWDSVNEALFLARDPLGIKPLYYLDNGVMFRFASQVRALKTASDIQLQENEIAEAGFLIFGTIPEPETNYKEISALPAGHYLKIGNSKTEKKRFWKFSDIYEGKEEITDFNQLISKAVSDSVKAHMVADVPVALFLSSGLDSAAIAACMRQHSKQEIIAITLRYEEYIDTPDDETIYAAKIAERYELNHHIHTVSKKEFEQDMPLLLKAMDQPTIDGVNIWFVAKTAKKLGLKVALSGLGGDELFGGYPSFRNIPKWTKVHRIFSMIPFGRSLFKLILHFFPKQSVKAKFLLDYASDFPGAYLLQRAIYLPNEVCEFMPKKKAHTVIDKLNWRKRLNDIILNIRQPLSKISAMESCWYMRHQLLRDADWAGMAHSIEIRTPLVDKILFEAIAPYQEQSIERSGKLPLANLLDKALAEQLLERPKTGFTLPMKDWLEQETGKQQHWSRLYVKKLHNLFFANGAA